VLLRAVFSKVGFFFLMAITMISAGEWWCNAGRGGVPRLAPLLKERIDKR
jgi:hypothetical protein